MMEKSDLPERLGLQAKLLIRTGVLYDIWRVQTDPVRRSFYLNTMNRYSEFFVFNESVYLSSTITALHTLTERKPNTLNISDSMALLKRHHPELTGRVNSVRKEYDKNFDLFRRLSLLRHNIYAHRSARISYEDTFRKAQVSPDKIREAIGACKIALDGLFQLVGLDPFELREIPRDDFLRMLEDLRTLNPDSEAVELRF